MLAFCGRIFKTVVFAFLLNEYFRNKYTDKYEAVLSSVFYQSVYYFIKGQLLLNKIKQTPRIKLLIDHFTHL